MLVGNAESLEECHVTNAPTWASVTVAWSDEYLESFIRTNSLKNLKNLTFRMNKDAFVEAGSFTEQGLNTLLDHCSANSPKLTNLIGEFTKITDSQLAAKIASYRDKGLRRLMIKNAVHYRKFESPHDSERYYSMNEGYMALMEAERLAAQMGEVNLQQQDQSQQPRRAGQSRNQRFRGYHFRPYRKEQEDAESSD